MDNKIYLRQPPGYVWDFVHEVIAGNIPGHRIMEGLGERESIGTTTNGEDICRLNELSSTPASPASHVLIPTPAAAGEQMTIISQSANDSAAGTGIQTVQIDYLDGGGRERTTVETMNGLTGVNLTPNDVSFVQEMGGQTIGSNGVAAGHIRIYQTADPTLVYNMIAAGGNQSLVPHRQVPMGKTLYTHEWIGSEGANKRLTLRMRADCDHHVPPNRQAGVFRFLSSVYCNQSNSGAMPFPYIIPELSIVKCSAWAVAINGEASVYWWGVLVDN